MKKSGRFRWARCFGTLSTSGNTSAARPSTWRSTYKGWARKARSSPAWGATRAATERWKRSVSTAYIRSAQRDERFATGVAEAVLDETGSATYRIPRAAFDEIQIGKEDLAALNAYAPDLVCFGSFEQRVSAFPRLRSEHFTKRESGLRIFRRQYPHGFRGKGSDRIFAASVRRTETERGRMRAFGEITLRERSLRPIVLPPRCKGSRYPNGSRDAGREGVFRLYPRRGEAYRIRLLRRAEIPSARATRFRRRFCTPTFRGRTPSRRRTAEMFWARSWRRIRALCPRFPALSRTLYRA